MGQSLGVFRGGEIDSSLGLAAVALFAHSLSRWSRQEQAQAHRHGCHRAHTCPSDHSTYRWRGRIGGVTARWLCVHRSSPKRKRTFNRRVRYGGRIYFCKQ
jgi:hypothetical protein